MSKSLGNSIDPLTVIEKYSADALRFSLIILNATGQDVYLSDEKFEIGRNFGTKIWNAARFMQMHSEEPPEDFERPELDAELLSADDQHILAKLNATIAACSENLERFRFNDVAREMYDFLWHQYCDWYVEYSKQVLYGEDERRKAQVLKVMHHVFSSALRLMHPLMPFITEELWQEMGYNRISERIMRAPWPVARDYEELQDWGINRSVVDYVDAKHDLIRVARTLMADYNLLPKHNVHFIVRPADDKQGAVLRRDVGSIAALLRASELRVDSAFQPEQAMPSMISKLGTVYMPIEGLIDVDAEIERLSTQAEKVSDDLVRVTKKLDNMDFISKAPKEVVERQRTRKKELLEKSEKLKKLLATLTESERSRV
jgi:valyl-tRNA synthetase